MYRQAIICTHNEPAAQFPSGPVKVPQADERRHAAHFRQVRGRAAARRSTSIDKPHYNHKTELVAGRLALRLLPGVRLGHVVRLLLGDLPFQRRPRGPRPREEPQRAEAS